MEAFEEPDIAGMRAYDEELRRTHERMAAEGLALHDKARAVQVTEQSADGLVTVTVGARGDLIGLDIDPRVYRRPDTRVLADTILQTVRAAEAKAQDQVVEIFEPLIPAEQMRAHIEGDLELVMQQLAAQLPDMR
ncbi:YbaB/EbfC family nucleoid-associated protein [Streptosporangium sp. KLBMP 9127]|nr:YbaB/EbfC family nucleoid-associated protein [Streptosporangium sp. KLBMP 9127]